MNLVKTAAISGGASALAKWGSSLSLNLRFRRFLPGSGLLEPLISLSKIFERAWEFDQPVYMCFVDLEKAFDRVPLSILWVVLWKCGVCGLLL